MTALFLLFLKSSPSKLSLPWWWECHKILPLAVEAFVMIGAGLIDIVMGSLG